jgi:hypothetical protein
LPQPYNVLGLVIASSYAASLQLPYGSWYGDTLQMRITQSISLSNIQTFSHYRKGPPSGGENLPMFWPAS